MAEELEQFTTENNDNTALIQQLENLTEVINTQIELDQQEKEEQAQLEVEQQQQLEQEQQTLVEQEEALKQEQIEFQQSVLESISELDGSNDLSALLEQQAQLLEKQEEIIEMYHEVFPAVKQYSEWGIIFLGLIPLFLVVRWIGQLFDGALR